MLMRCWVTYVCMPLSTCVEVKRLFARVGSFLPWWVSGIDLRLVCGAAGPTVPQGIARSICTTSDNTGIEHLNLIVFAFFLLSA